MRKIIRTDGTEYKLDKPVPIKDIASHIGTDICDIVMLKDHVHVMYVDDLGHQKGLPINQKATELYWEKCGRKNDWYIVGDVLIVPDADHGD